MHSFIRRSNHKGFTLIELLIVIAIISLLAAILSPVFARTRERAALVLPQQSQQISIAIHQYTQDYDERYPLWVQCKGGTDPTVCYGNDDWWAGPHRWSPT